MNILFRLRLFLVGAAAALCLPHAAAQSYAFTTLAGAPSLGSADTSSSGSARFAVPSAITIDVGGNVFVGDSFNFTIRKIYPGGGVTTYVGAAGSPGSADGSGSVARVGAVAGMTTDFAGNVYFTDSAYHTVRKISLAGVVTTIAGSPGIPGSADGIAGAAQFDSPIGIVADPNGNLFVVDAGNCTIRKIDRNNAVTTIAGAVGIPGSADGKGTAAQFRSPYGITIDANGNLFVTDSVDCTIRKIDSAGNVTTWAGAAGVPGTTNGPLTTARFYHPAGLTIDAYGYMFVADYSAHDVRIISPAGQVATLAGQFFYPGYTDGPLSGSRLYYPAGVAVDVLDRVYVADSFNCEIRKIDTSLSISTVAGMTGAGATDAIGTSAQFFLPHNVALSPSGEVYVADTYNQTIRKIAADGTVTTVAGAAGVQGSVDGAAKDARFRFPYGLAFDPAGNLYVADSSNETIRKITTTGAVGTLAGSAGVAGTADGAGGSARFSAPTDLKVDQDGNLLVVDSNNNTVRKVTPDGTVTTIAGAAGVSGNTDGPGLSARFSGPVDIALDQQGNAYITDSVNNVIRKMTRAGTVSTLAGLAGYSGFTDGTSGAARFNFPFGIAVDAVGDVFVSDLKNDAIREITPAGTVSTIGGAGFISATDGIGSDAGFWDPMGLAIDGAGNLYIADEVNHTIRKGGLVNPATPTSRLFNLSVRANLQANQRLITGFVVNGGTKPILIRAVGPGLTPYVGGQTVAGDPRLEVYDSALNLEDSNDDWGGGQTLRDAFVGVGAFPLDPASHDAALLRNLTGLHTAHMLSPSAGVALVEAYDAGSGTSARLFNVSARYTVGNGSTLIAGFVISGTNSKTLLIRGVGPTLASFGVTDALTDPHIDIYNATNQRIAGNDDWSPSLSASFTAMGAFALSSPKDAALLISLSPGLYSAQISGSGSETGEGLIEIYDVGN